MNTHDLIAAAQAAHTDYLADQAAEQAGEAATLESDRQVTVGLASTRATELFGVAAESLNWRHHPEGETGNHLSAAVASLPPGPTHDARLVYLHDGYTNNQSLVLARTCRACADELLNEVDSLADLGRLLDEGRPGSGDTHEDGADADDGQEPGPLAVIERIEAHASRVTWLARRLIAEHPEAGLAVDRVYFHSHHSSAGVAVIHFDTDSVDAVRQVASALNAEVRTFHSNAIESTVFEHADAKTTYDGIKVEFSGHRELSDDEAAAWRAQQKQTAEAADGGVV